MRFTAIIVPVVTAIVLVGPPGGSVARAQEFLGQRDFLTTHEVDLIREAQEPNLRIETYLQFASLRLELVRQLLEKEEAGRGAKIHRNLDEYGRILEAVDMVVDDALVRDVELEESIAPMVGRQKAFLVSLRKIEAADPEDLWRFKFVLEDAIEITSDSLELAEEDRVARKSRVIDSDEAEKAERQKSMTAERRREVEKAQAVREKTEQRSRGPSLLKDGESLDEADRAPKTKPPKKPRR